MRKFITAAIVVPLVVILIAFAVANRQIVTISFDPFDATRPAFALTAPLFILIFVLVGLGVLIGGAAAWFKQHKWRARARLAEAEARELRLRIDATQPRRLPAAADTPPFAVPPAA
jgi:uncharacterized integral membrane protein